jgi:hypothetical protein
VLAKAQPTMLQNASLAYQRDGDVLVVCFNSKGSQSLPTDLTSQRGDGRILVTLRRVKKGG